MLGLGTTEWRTIALVWNALECYHYLSRLAPCSTHWRGPTTHATTAASAAAAMATGAAGRDGVRAGRCRGNVVVRRGPSSRRVLDESISSMLASTPKPTPAVRLPVPPIRARAPPTNRNQAPRVDAFPKLYE